jgi:hypothetical protein
MDRALKAERPATSHGRGRAAEQPRNSFHESSINYTNSDWTLPTSPGQRRRGDFSRRTAAGGQLGGLMTTMELVHEKERVVSEVARTTNHSRNHEADYDRSLRTDVAAIQRGSLARVKKWEPPSRKAGTASFPPPGGSSILSTSNKHRKNPPFSTTLQPTIPALKAVTNKNEDDHLLKWARNRLPWTPPSPKASSNSSPISVRDDDDHVEVQEVNVEQCGAQHPGALVGPLPLERESVAFSLSRAPNRKRKTTAAATRDQVLGLDSFLTDLAGENRVTVQAREEAEANDHALRHQRQRRSSESVIELIDDEPAEMPEESPSGASGGTIVPPHPGSNLSCDTLATLSHDSSLSSDSTLRVDSSPADNAVQRSRSNSPVATLSDEAVSTPSSIMSSFVASASRAASRVRGFLGGGSSDRGGAMATKAKVATTQPAASKRQSREGRATNRRPAATTVRPGGSFLQTEPSRDDGILAQYRRTQNDEKYPRREQPRLRTVRLSGSTESASRPEQEPPKEQRKL